MAFRARILPMHGHFSYRNGFNLRLMKMLAAYKIRLTALFLRQGEKYTWLVY